MTTPQDFAPFNLGQLMGEAQQRRAQQQQMEMQQQAMQRQQQVGDLLSGALNGDAKALSGVASADPNMFMALEQRQQRRQAERVARTAPLAYRASRLPLEQRGAFIASVAPTLRGFGWTDEELAAFQPTDENLQGLIAAGQTLEQAQAQDRIEWHVVPGDGEAFATNGMGNPVAPGMAGQPAPAAPAAPSGQPRSFDPVPTAGGSLPPAAATLYNEFRNRGWTDEGARTMVAQIGRENGFNPEYMFGGHQDANPAAGQNAGIVSWNRGRRAALMNFMAQRGLVQNGRIVPGDEALRAQAQFADQEMQQRYPQSAAAVRDPNGNYQSIEPVLSNNYFGWDRAGHRINAQQHLARMGGYYEATAGLGGQPNPNQTAQAGPVPRPGTSPSVLDQAATGVIRGRSRTPPGFRQTPDGNLEAIPGGPGDHTYDRQRDATTDSRAERGERRQDQQAVGQVLNQFRTDPDVRAWRQARTSAMQIRTLGRSGTATDDIAMIFQFMKVLDPNSTVRESEFATAQNAAGVPDRIRNSYNQILHGTRLNPAQRNEMVSTAGRLYEDRSRTYNEQVESFREQAITMGVPPEQAARMFQIANAARDPVAGRRQRQGNANRPRSGRTTQGVGWSIAE